MNDFKKALGILSKAKQGGLFEKPAKVLGKTRSGKSIIDHHPSAAAFIAHHEGWTPEDHADAHAAHLEHPKYFRGRHYLPHRKQGVNIIVPLQRGYEPKSLFHHYMSMAHQYMNHAAVWESSPFSDAGTVTHMAKIKERVVNFVGMANKQKR